MFLVHAIHSIKSRRNLQRIVRPCLILYLNASNEVACIFSPTMGGLYFWVCKMKPDSPALGCEHIRSNPSLFSLSHIPSLYRLGIYYRHDVDGYIRQLEVSIPPVSSSACLPPLIYIQCGTLYSIVDRNRPKYLTDSSGDYRNCMGRQSCVRNTQYRRYKGSGPYELLQSLVDHWRDFGPCDNAIRKGS